MLSQWFRVFYSDNGTLTDYSLAAQGTDTIPFPVVAAEDYLYVAQHFPFNNFFFDINTVNSNASVMSVQYWEGTEWKDGVDVLDATASSGVSLSRDGVVQFSPDEDFGGWVRITDTSNPGEPTELQTLKIYNLYWMRVKFSADLSLGTILDKVGYKFAVDEQLNAIEPEIEKYLTAWETGKTDWNEQIQLASQHLVWDLKAKNLIVDRGQIIRFDDVSLATAYRTLAHIYAILGKGFEDKMDWAMKEYNGLLANQRFTFDRNQNAIVDVGEINNSPKKLIR